MTSSDKTTGFNSDRDIDERANHAKGNAAITAIINNGNDNNGNDPHRNRLT